MIKDLENAIIIFKNIRDAIQVYDLPLYVDMPTVTVRDKEKKHLRTFTSIVELLAYINGHCDSLKIRE